MKIVKTEIKDCFILEPMVFKDSRGYFFESYNQRIFESLTNISCNFVQSNESYSSYGVIRGLHAQRGAFAQAKLVRVVKGRVLDVILDARKESPSFGKIVSVILDGESKNQIFLPKGCLHGFSVLEDDTIFSYKCDAVYNKESEIGLNPLDCDLNIDWKIKPGLAVISEKDRNALGWMEFLEKTNGGRSGKVEE